MINFAVFGVGRIGIMHAKNIIENDRSKLLYIYDINKKIAKKVSKKYNCKIANSPEEALNDNKDNNNI